MVASKSPRKEKDVLAKVEKWCHAKFPNVEVQKEEYYKFIEVTGEKKMIDATLIGHYKKKDRIGGKGCLIAELEFEEHQQTTYSILGDQLKITALLRKLAYWRNDIPQYWIKIDRDGTPFMINFRYIYDNRHKLDIMKRVYGNFSKPNQKTRIIAADRPKKSDPWPSYVIIGWEDIFKELERIVVLAGF